MKGNEITCVVLYVFSSSTLLIATTVEGKTMNKIQVRKTEENIIKRKVRPTTGHDSPDGEEKSSSTLSLTLELDGGGWLRSRPGHFTNGKETRCPLYRRLGGPQCRSRRVQKTSSPPGFDPRTAQLVASRCTD
jgi:hypothetical protein